MPHPTQLPENVMAHSTPERHTPFVAKLTLVFIAAACSAIPPLVLAAEFRIETEIFVDDEEQPVSTATTMFHGGVVYDFLVEPEQAAIFRKPGGGKPGRFILLDPVRRVRTELSTDQLAGAMDKLTTWASRQQDPFLQFAANPKFDESYSEESGKLVLASHEESYQIATTPAHEPDALGEYREFLDWYARLNTLLVAGPPPGPRLQVNAAMARYQVIPVSVQLTRSGEKIPLRAEHEFTWRLSKDDLARIDDACASLAAYRPVSNDEFLHGMRPGKASK
jgi:hypothetical protein